MGDDAPSRGNERMAIGSLGSVEGFRGIAAVPRSHWISGGAQRGNEGVEDMPDSSWSSPVCWASLVKFSVHRGSASNIYMFKAHPFSCVFLSSRTTLVRHEEGDSYPFGRGRGRVYHPMREECRPLGREGTQCMYTRCTRPTKRSRMVGWYCPNELRGRKGWKRWSKTDKSLY